MKLNPSYTYIEHIDTTVNCSFKDRMAVIYTCFTHWLLSGGDQGLLNSFFSSWPVEDISKHLPFVYNLSASRVYSYLPAFQQ